MSEQDSLKQGPWLDSYYSGLRSGYLGTNTGAKYWDPPGPEENHFDLFSDLDKLRTALPSHVREEGELRGAAFGINKAVHNAYYWESTNHPGQVSTPDGYEGSASPYISGIFTSAVDMTKDRDVSALLNEPAVKEVVPEIALAELYGNFEGIHDARVPGGITRQDLETYVKNCGEDDPLRKVVVDYALAHFDKIHQLDGDNPGITKSALEGGLKIFAAAETEKTELRVKEKPDERVLHFLDENFDKIRDPKFPGISQFDLERYFSGDCKFEQKQEVFREFDQIRNLDPADGDLDYHYLWMKRGNSADITRSDVSTGLASIANDRARVQQIQALFDDWAK